MGSWYDRCHETVVWKSSTSTSVLRCRWRLLCLNVRSPSEVHPGAQGTIGLGRLLSLPGCISFPKIFPADNKPAPVKSGVQWMHTQCQENHVMQYPIEPNSELPRWMQVSQPARKLFTRIAGTPLASGPVLSQMEGHDAPYASPYLKELEGSGLVSSVRLGGVTDPAARCFVEAYGREFLRYSDRCWHDDGGRALLLERFPATEILPTGRNVHK